MKANTLKLIGASLLAFAGFNQLSAANFINGDFESNNFNGWTRGSGQWSSANVADLTTTNYSPGGAFYNAAYDQSAITNAGFDANTGGVLSTVYSGAHSVRVNNSINDYSVSLIKQTVANYTDTNIFFAWAAVLEDSHGPTDSDNFRLTLTNDTLGLTLYDVTYNSATAPAGLFNQFGNWNWTQWQVQNLDVSAYLGDTFTLSLLASDCPYGGHAGYVYLDGFGAVIPPGGGSAVPEPSTYGMMGAAALMGLVVLRRRKAQKSA